MAKIKGTSKEMSNRVFARYGPEAMQRFLNSLTPEQREIHEHATGIRWVELETDEENSGLIKTARALFPNDSMRLKRLGREMAQYGFATIYKMFFRVPSLTYLFKKVATQWSQIYDTGQASVENITSHSCTVVVRGFPDMPAYLREFLAGFYEGMGIINGAKNPQVLQDENNPNEWKWDAIWE